MMSGFNIAYISLGSNLGDRNKLLLAAEREIENIQYIRILRRTSVLENRALIYENQPDFLNQILEIETRFTPEILLEKLKSIENGIGRTRSFRYGPRLIDLDILSFGNVIRNTEDLILPHAGFYDRHYIRILLEELSLTPEIIFPLHQISDSEGSYHAYNSREFVYGKRNG